MGHKKVYFCVKREAFLRVLFLLMLGAFLGPFLSQFGSQSETRERRGTVPMEHQKLQEDDRSQDVILGHFLTSKNLLPSSTAPIQVHGRGLGEGKPSPGGYCAW